MSAWKPTDEQIESMADQLFHERMPLHDWPPHNTQQADNWRLISRDHMASLAFQSIIRAAQAEAWEQGKSDGIKQADWEYGNVRGFFAASNPFEVTS